MPSGVCFFLTFFHLFSLRRIQRETNNFHLYHSWHFLKYFHVHYFIWFFNSFTRLQLLEGKAIFHILQVLCREQANFSLMVKARVCLPSSAPWSITKFSPSASWTRLAHPLLPYHHVLFIPNYILLSILKLNTPYTVSVTYLFWIIYQ